MRFFKCFIALSIIAFFIESCETTQPVGVYQDDKISSGTRDKIKGQNDLLMAAAKNNNQNHEMDAILSKEMLETTDYKRAVELISNQKTDGKYSVLNEYYIHDNAAGHNSVIKPANGTYTIGFHSTVPESYVSLLTLDNLGDKWLVVASYGKFDYGWRLTALSCNRYAINGKTPPELLAQAQKDYAKGYIINALNNMELAVKAIHPSDMWVYPNEKNILDFYGAMGNLAAVKYKFPIYIPVPSKPFIFRIMNQTEKTGGFVPTVKYVTKVKLTDTKGLQSELDGIKKEIGKILPGIDQDNRLIVFEAYNQKPEGSSNPLSVEMVYKLK